MSAGHARGKEPTWEEAETLLDEVLAHPKIKARLTKPYRLVTTYDIPLLGSSSVGGKHVYLDRHLKSGQSFGVIRVGDRNLDVKRGLVRHERLEQALEDELGWKYDTLAHPIATHWEERDYRAKGFDPAEVEKAFEPYIKADAHEKIQRCPTDMDLRPELAPPEDTKILAHIRKCQNTEKVAQDKVGYVEKAPRAGQSCSKCAMFVKPLYGGPCCTLVKDEVRAEGYCRRFIAGALENGTR